jgi:hypothetical protein
MIVEACGQWGLDALVDPATLIASELVANAVAHTPGPTLRVTVTRPATVRLRVAVADSSPHAPKRRDAADGDEGGRGLAIVAAFAAAWGTEPAPEGKAVWAELAPETPAHPGDADRAAVHPWDALTPAAYDVDALSLDASELDEYGADAHEAAPRTVDTREANTREAAGAAETAPPGGQ